MEVFPQFILTYSARKLTIMKIFQRPSSMEDEGTENTELQAALQEGKLELFFFDNKNHIDYFHFTNDSYILYRYY